MNNPTKVDTLQSLVTSWVHGISKGRLVSTLQKLGLACATRVLTRGQDEEIVDESFKIKFCRWGIVILQFDNLGFKRGGAKAGYTQYTTLLWTEVPYFILEKCGVYEASRTRGAPPSDAKEYLPSRGDYEAVNERMLYSFELAMEASPHLLDDVLDEKERQMVRVKIDPQLAAARSEVAHDGGVAAMQALTSDVDLEDDDAAVFRASEEKRKTMYASDWGEDMHTDNILKMDLNATSTVSLHTFV